MGLFDLFKSKKKIIVIDGVSLSEAMGMKGDVPPRNQLQLLRRLSRFAEREKVNLVVVLSGTPLNKAPAGEQFEKIQVLYSASSDVHENYVLKVARSKGSAAVLVSGNASLERTAVSRGSSTMRLSTFRKAFDANGNENGSDRFSGDRNGGRNRPPRRRSQRNSGGNNGGKNGGNNQSEPRRSEPRNQQPPKEKNQEIDAINELIDLID